MTFAQLFGPLSGFEFAYYIAPRSTKSLFRISKLISDYIVDQYMDYLTNISHGLNFKVSIQILLIRYMNRICACSGIA